MSCKKESSLSQKTNGLGEVTTTTGNGAPSGPHYNLNIIGVDNPKNFDYNTVDQQNTQGQGHRIFVPLDGNAKILLREGDFSVLDANGTDGIAAFQLPKPDSNNDGITSYSVFIRGLGKTGGTATMSSCITDGTDTYCSIDQGVSVSLSAHGMITNSQTCQRNFFMYMRTLMAMEPSRKFPCSAILCSLTTGIIKTRGCVWHS
jgi:hypothetical protein